MDEGVGRVSLLITSAAKPIERDDAQVVLPALTHSGLAAFRRSVLRMFVELKNVHLR